MASGTVGVHLDKLTIERLRAMASVENRSPSQIQAVALKLFLDMPSGARRALFAIDGIGSEDERNLQPRRWGGLRSPPMTASSMRATVRRTSVPVSRWTATKPWKPRPSALPLLTDERVIRLAVDINVFVADILSSRPQGRASASTRIVEAVREGRCRPAPSNSWPRLPMIEDFADVFRRRLGYSRSDADEKAWLLEQYALDGPMPSKPYVSVGSSYIPFETEEQLRSAVESQLRPANAGQAVQRNPG